MSISRLTVDKLGMRLYDRVSAVIAELVANSYDADATEVIVEAPMDVMLARKEKGDVTDLGYRMLVRDNGVGMTPDQVNDFYLKIGGERRKDPRRGGHSKKYGRAVMGRKGVGKLAPFGVCRFIEVISAGGEEVQNTGEDGATQRGFLTAHLVLDRDAILSDTDEDYPPVPGDLDGTLSNSTGTSIIMRDFAYRRVPELDEFSRQLSQRFGLESPLWSIKLVDSSKEEGSPEREGRVGMFSVTTLPGSKITFYKGADEENPTLGAVKEENGQDRTDIQAGFSLDDHVYPVYGWVAYSSEPYKDDLMAGIRIYCHGKIAAQTSVFNRGAGFTGEHDVRSYLVGELHADWLDDEEDLIQTDRRDILWSHELGQAFEHWGQVLVVKMGSRTRDPLRRKSWEEFLEVSDIVGRANKAFPLPDQGPIRDQVRTLAKLIGGTMRGAELKNPDQVESVVHLCLEFAPHVTLDETLREAAEEKDSPLGVIAQILSTARVAELSSFGQIASNRVKVIQSVEELKDDKNTLEQALQKLITEAPWLIDPQWSPIAENRSFSTLRTEFQKHVKERTGEDLHLGNFTDPDRRADFVLSNQDRALELIEIKRPYHRFEDEEMDRLEKYVNLMTEFLDAPQNAEFRKLYPSFNVTLVCDGEKLSPVYKRAFKSLQDDKILTWVGWKTFLLRTKRVHQSFLDEYERQKGLLQSD